MVVFASTETKSDPTDGLVVGVLVVGGVGATLGARDGFEVEGARDGLEVEGARDGLDTLGLEVG